MNDLERRALAAIEAVPRSEIGPGILKRRRTIHAELGRTLNLSRLSSHPAGPGLLYLPSQGSVPAPAVLLLRPHRDPTQREAQLLPAAIAHRGMIVLELDVRASHSRLDLLAEGIVPQSLMQRDVRAGLAFLRGSTDVNPRQLGLMGEGLAATLAMAMSAEFSAVIVLDGAPDLRSVIRQWRALPSGQPPDSCALLPGLLKYAATEELLSLIPPRSLLLFRADSGPGEYATSVYRAHDSLDRLQQRQEEEWTPTARAAAYAWLAKWWGRAAPPASSPEPSQWAEPVSVTFEPPAEPASSVPSAVTPGLLTTMLGQPLPQGSMTFGLNCRGDQHIDFSTQAGLTIPVTAMRPGPDGCDAARGTLIAVDDSGRQALAGNPIVREALRRGWIVWMVDPRGVGELRGNQDAFAFGASLLLGENFTWRQSSLASCIP